MEGSGGQREWGGEESALVEGLLGLDTDQEQSKNHWPERAPVESPGQLV